MKRYNKLFSTIKTVLSLKIASTITPDLKGLVGQISTVFEKNKRDTACYLSKDARAGIRTRVGGMKTHYDGPGYTTRATAVPPTTP